MIKAEHKRWARIFYDIYITFILKKNFNRFLLTNEFPFIDKSLALLVTPNHFSWWDGFFIDYYMRNNLQRKIHLLMLEDQLKRYWFFNKVGAYSIKLNNPKSVIETLSYTSTILKDDKNFVVYYPQGKIEQYDKRPPTIKDGIMKVVEKTERIIIILPIGFKIYYSNAKHPDILVRAGQPILVKQKENFIEQFKIEFEANLKQLDMYAPTGKEQDLFKR